MGLLCGERRSLGENGERGRARIVDSSEVGARNGVHVCGVV
jgi:hypothetical protein